MDLFEVLDRIRELLRTKGRVSYRLMQAQFALDAAALDGLKDELIEAEQVARDENGKVLVWVGDGSTPTQPTSPSVQPSASQPPSTYTLPHLAERIRAEQAAMESRGAAGDERKTITALFADLKGSTALIT